MSFSSPSNRLLICVAMLVVGASSPLAVCAGPASAPTANTAAAAPGRVVVTDEGVPSAYGAPGSFSRSRFAPLTQGYVLPPFGVYAGVDYELDSPKEGYPSHLFTQELEVGLPHRFGVAVENSFSAFRGHVEESTFSVEARYALADWNKIPLNPTVFFEYKFGIGHVTGEEASMEGDKMVEVEKVQEMARRRSSRRHSVHRTEEEDMPGGDPDAGEEEEGGSDERMPDAFEVRLLLSQDFGDRFEWALNGFFEQEVGGDRGREWGFAQSFATPVLLDRERLKIGVEMQYRNFTHRNARSDPDQAFILGPSIAFKPSRNTRLDLSPLFGVTEDAPRLQLFAIFSCVFGPGGESHEAESPASTRNR